MIVSDPVELETVLLSIGEAELFSRHLVERLGTDLTEAVSERLRFSTSADWTPEDRQALLDGVRKLWGPTLEPLLRLEPRWFRAVLGTPEVEGLRTPATLEFQRLAPDRRLSTLVAAIEDGKDTPDAVFSGGFRRLKREFNPRRMRGVPCLVGGSSGGPYTVVDGLLRLAVVDSLTQSSRPIPDQFPVHLGVTERLNGWDLAASDLPSTSTAEPASFAEAAGLEANRSQM